MSVNKEFNCPDCMREDTCEGCPRTLNRDSNITIKHIPPYFPDSVTWDNKSSIPSCCRNCYNHPINGGEGICNCTLPLFSSETPYKITCSSSTSNTYIIE